MKSHKKNEPAHRHPNPQPHQVLQKNRGIENLNLEVQKGEIFGFLGPNGAGKTTTSRLLLDLIRKTSRKATIFGYDTQKESQKIRECVAYVPGELGFYQDWTGRRTLQYLFKLYNHPARANYDDGGKIFRKPK
jgi:ABC-type multidrug transport system ATPase subunit